MVCFFGCGGEVGLLVVGWVLCITLGRHDGISDKVRISTSERYRRVEFK